MGSAPDEDDADADVSPPTLSDEEEPEVDPPEPNATPPEEQLASPMTGAARAMKRANDVELFIGGAYRCSEVVGSLSRGDAPMRFRMAATRLWGTITTIEIR